MLLLIVVCLLVILLFVNLRINDRIMKNVLYAFYAFWGVSLVISVFNPYGLNQVKYSTYALILLFLISYTIGVLIAPRAKYRAQTQDYSSFLNVMANNKLLLFIVFVLDCFLIYLYSKQKLILSLYSVAELRINLDELLYSGNSLLGLTKNMLINPLTPIITFLGAYILVFNRQNILPLILYLTYVCFSALIDGSRGGFLNVAVYCFFIIICQSVLIRKRIKFKQLFIRFIPIVLLVLVIMAYMTAQRSYNIQEFSWEAVSLGANELSKHFVTYLVGPFRALDYALGHNYLDAVGGYQYGRCTLGFVDTMMQLILNTIGVEYEAGVKQLAHYVQNNWIDIGDNHYFNFAYTAILFYYVDFDLLGVIIFPLLLGYFSRIIINKIYTKNNPCVLILAAFIFTVLYGTGFTWRLYRHDTFVTICLIVIMYIWYNKKYTRVLSKNNF